MYKLLLFDLDGTLLTTQREITALNVSTLQKLMAQNMRVGFATGRSLKSVKPFIEKLQPNGPLILFNGARVWDPLGKRYVFEKNLGYDEALVALKLIREFRNIHVNLYVGDEIYIAHRSLRSEESEVKDGVAHSAVGDLALWLEDQKFEPIKMMLIAEPPALEEFAHQFKQLVKKPCSLIRSEWNYLEIMQEGVSKGGALQAIQENFDIPSSEIIAFGDNLNDMTLIKGCGMGIAMENAHDDLKACAHKTIGHHESDAIHLFLKEIFHD
jgi:Cof subfamily protein (haloacid dehalogenase superfamily)